MIELRIYTEDYTGFNTVDLFEDEPIYYELSFAEIQDISKKNSGFTKTFNLPGTPKNNRFFNNFYDPSVVSTSFDTRIKHNASINYNGYEIAVGYIRLEKVTTEKDTIIYTVIFYNQIGDLVSRMGDKKLNELVTNGSTGNDNFDHIWSRNNITSSWYINDSTPSSGLLEGRVLYPLLNRGYAYNEISGGADVLSVEKSYTGLLNVAGVYDNTIARGTYIPTDPTDLGFIHNEYFSPSIQLKSLFKLILNDNNYKLESDFFDNNPWVNRIYLPTTYNTEDFGAVQIPNEEWDVKENQFNINSTLVNHFFDYNDVIQDTYNRWNTSQEWTSGLEGWHLFEVEFNVENTGATQRDFEIVIYQNPPTVELEVATFNVAGGDSASFKLKRWVNLPNTGPWSLVFKTASGFNNPCSFTDINFRQLKSTRYGPVYDSNTSGPLLSMRQQLGGEISQVDLISSVLKQFNLIMVPKVDDENTLIVEPLKDWIGTGELVDWTTKVNRDKPIQITDTTKFVNGIIDLKPNEGKDFLNENYKKENRLLFGQREELLNTDYKEKSTKIQSIFSISQQELISPTSDFTLPVFYQAKDENVNGENVRVYKTFKTTPTLIYYSGIRNIYTRRSVYMNYYKNGWGSGEDQTPQEIFPQSHHLTYYPVVTATQNKSISFNKDQQQGSYKQITVHDDCYTMFYEDMVDDYIDEESRFMKCELYLEPEEVKKLDFSEQIIIDNARWRINKLSKINMTEPSLVQGEFIKLFEDLGRTDIDADMITLTSCGSNPPIYTTTTLNPDLVILTGLIVKVNGSCYLIEPPQPYNSQLTYTQITLDNNNGVPYTFTFCSECGETGGGLCEPIIDINAVTGTGGIIVGIFSQEIFDPNGSQFQEECYEERYYWNCNTNSFKVQNANYIGQCDYADGWTNVSGGSQIIPNPINRPGYLVDECCYDSNTGFNYDVYTEIVGDQMILHKICCSIQPTTTTSTTQPTTTTTTIAPTTTTTTTIAGQAIRIKYCDGGFEIDVILDPTQGTVSIGDVMNGEVCIWNSQSQTYNCYNNICYQVIAGGDAFTSNTAGISPLFVDCATCEGTSTTTTTTQTPTYCETWEIITPTMSGELIEIEYTDCNGNFQNDVFGWNTGTHYVCAEYNTMVLIEVGPGGSVTVQGLC